MIGPLDISTFDTPAGVITLVKGGPPIPVRTADGVVMKALHRLGFAAAQLVEHPEQDVHPDLMNTRILWDLAKRCVPSLTEEEVDGLTAIQCGIIIRVAQGRIQELLAQVEALEKKAPGADEAPPPETNPASSVPG